MSFHQNTNWDVTFPFCVEYDVCYVLVDFYWPQWTFENLMMVIILVITVQQFAWGLRESRDYLKSRKENTMATLNWDLSPREQKGFNNISLEFSSPFLRYWIRMKCTIWRKSNSVHVILHVSGRTIQHIRPCTFQKGTNLTFETVNKNISTRETLSY